jgi:alginate O-acetyltransferase complex protein AlgI
MIFSSEVFLFGYLPVALGLYFASPNSRVKNVALVVASLFFYFWGEGRYVFLVLGLALLNYAFARTLSDLPDAATSLRRGLLALAVAIDIGTLVYFKYSAFLAQNLHALVGGSIGTRIAASHVYLPLGISFFTFHAVSYVVDVYRRTSQARRNPLEVVLYFVFFPQLIAGPIIRYKDVADQLSARGVSLEDIAYGIRRFVAGLAKKVLIADTLAGPVDRIFATDPHLLSAPAAWFGISAYALQIYFDFSGYSDMAIGLARMFGFRFLENFNFPYVAGSIREFWQRWNISLSRWMRDYLYIPLGGNRVAAWRVYLNLVVVFFLCGLWHGAKWTFVVWGLIHGLFLVLERIGVTRPLTSLPVVRNVYALSVVCFAWVFFRSDSFSQALAFLTVLVRPPLAPVLTLQALVDHETIVAFALGSLLAAPWVSAAVEAAVQGRSGRRSATVASFAVPAGTVLLFVTAVAKLAAGTYSPFLYFRF